MENLRLFIAIDIPEPLKKKLTSLQQTIFADTNVKWVEQQNLHLTLKFLGDTPSDRCPDIIQAIQQTGAEFSPFELKLKGVGTFPAKGSPKVVWIGIGAEKSELIALQQKLEQNLAGIGFPPEGRKYSPHLTLGRPRETHKLVKLQTNINQHKDQEVGIWQVSAMKLIQSTLTKSGPIYQTLATITLG